MYVKKGQGLIEFSAVTAILILVCITTLYFFGDSLKEIFDTTKIQTIFDRDSSRTNF